MDGDLILYDNFSGYVGGVSGRTGEGKRGGKGEGKE
jgi:hypothetical protein